MNNRVSARSRHKSKRICRISACTDTSSALVISSQTMKRGLSTSARDADALALAAGKFMRITPEMLGVELHPQQGRACDLQPLLARSADAVHGHRFDQGMGDREAGIERRLRVV